MNETQINKLLDIINAQLESNPSDFKLAESKAIDFLRSNPIDPEKLIEISTSLGSKGIYNLAYIVARAAAHFSTGSLQAIAYYNAGLASYLLNDKHQSEAQYKLAIKADPNHANAHYNYGNLLEEMGRGEEAEAQYKLVIIADPNDAGAHYNYGNILQEMGRGEEAEAQYKLAIKAGPNHSSAHSNYGNILQEMGRGEEAEAQYKLAIKANPNHASAHFNYGNLLKEVGRDEEAEDQYKHAIKADPNHSSAHSNYGILLKEMRRGEEAEAQYKLAIKADPNEASAHSNYGILLQEMGRGEEAETQHKLAIKADPNEASAHSNYGILLQEMGRGEEAEVQYKLAIKADSNDASSHGAYGLLLVNLDKREKAIKETETASGLFAREGNNIMKYVSKAWMYERFSEKYFKKREFLKSSDDASQAADHYFEAAEYEEDIEIKDSFNYNGYFLKARASIRKIPRLSGFDKFKKKIGKHPDIGLMVNNLNDASDWYEKAATCRLDDKRDYCSACSNAVGVLSEVLRVLQELLEGDTPDIGKKEWKSKIDTSRNIYSDKSDTGVALVDNIEKLIECVTKIADHRKNGVDIQLDKIGDCYKSLYEISNDLDGALGVISEHYTNIIGKYAKDQGYSGILDVKKEGKIKRLTRRITEDPYVALIIILLTILGFILMF